MLAVRAQRFQRHLTSSEGSWCSNNRSHDLGRRLCPATNRAIRIFIFSLMSVCLVLLTFDPFRDNERLRRNTSHVKRQTAKPNLEENVPTPGSRANQLQSDRLPS